MTVRELIEFLNGCDMNAQVVVSYRDDGGSYVGYDSDLECLVNGYRFMDTSLEENTVVL